MGTGKTSTGKELARRLKRKFIDLDDLIEAKENLSIPEIFSKFGEPHFRILENIVLKEISKENEQVVACGGGIVINPDNIKIMRGSGILICLTASVNDILKRTSRYKNRPLLNVDDPRKQIEVLLEKRAFFYALADEVIDTSGLSVIETANKVLEKLVKR